MHANISISQMPALSLFQPGCPFLPYGASDAELAPYNFDVAAMDAAALQSQSAQLATALVGGGGGRLVPEHAVNTPFVWQSGLIYVIVSVREQISVGGGGQAECWHQCIWFE